VSTVANVMPGDAALLQINEAKVQEHLDGIVRQTVADTLNALLDAEADRLCGAKRYETSSSLSDLSKTVTGLPLSVTMTGPFLVAFTYSAKSAATSL
jgi:hypothetical protein